MKLLSVKESAEMLSISERTIEGWILNQNHLGPKFIKIGGLRKVQLEDVERFIGGAS